MWKQVIELHATMEKKYLLLHMPEIVYVGDKRVLLSKFFINTTHESDQHPDPTGSFS